MNDELHTAVWLVSHLEADTGPGGLFDPARDPDLSGAFFEVIPPDRPLPAVRFHVQARSDVRGAAKASTRIMTQIDWLVVCVFEGRGVSKMIPYVDALDARLGGDQGTNGSTSDLWVLSCFRLEPFNMFEPSGSESGVQYRHTGGLYRTIVQPK